MILIGLDSLLLEMRLGLNVLEWLKDYGIYLRCILGEVKGELIDKSVVEVRVVEGKNCFLIVYFI